MRLVANSFTAEQPWTCGFHGLRISRGEVGHLHRSRAQCLERANNLEQHQARGIEGTATPCLDTVEIVAQLLPGELTPYLRGSLEIIAGFNGPRLDRLILDVSMILEDVDEA